MPTQHSAGMWWDFWLHQARLSFTTQRFVDLPSVMRLFVSIVVPRQCGKIGFKFKTLGVAKNAAQGSRRAMPNYSSKRTRYPRAA